MGGCQGVQLQRYRDGGLADATTFRSPRVSWGMGGATGRTRTKRPVGVADGRGRGGADAAGRIPARKPVLSASITALN